MKGKCGLGFIALGTALIIGAVSIVGYNVYEDKKSGESAEAVLMKMKEEIVPEETSESIEKNKSELFNEYENEDVLLEIDGETYIGYISIPSIDIELPVTYEWDYDKLKASPCRYSGSISGNDIVILAHNYSSHFGEIESLSSGDILRLINGAGKAFEYEVVNTETINGKDISAMTADSDSWDLTLFTCTLSGQSRVTVRAVRK